MQFVREMWASFRGLPVLAQLGIGVALVSLTAVAGGALDEAEEVPVSTTLTLPRATTTTEAPTTTSTSTTTTTVPTTTTRAPTTTRATAAPPTRAPVTEVYYANCAEARAAGAAPIRRGQPGYRSGLDRDGDGIACDT